MSLKFQSSIEKIQILDLLVSIYFAGSAVFRDSASQNNMS